MIPLPGDHAATRLAIPSTLCHDGPSRLDILPALLAQLAEQLTLNQRVVGSSPTGGTSDVSTPGDRGSCAGRRVRLGKKYGPPAGRSSAPWRGRRGPELGRPGSRGADAPGTIPGASAAPVRVSSPRGPRGPSTGPSSGP